jgi:hypothetical protein
VDLGIPSVLDLEHLASLEHAKELGSRAADLLGMEPAGDFFGAGKEVTRVVPEIQSLVRRLRLQPERGPGQGVPAQLIGLVARQLQRVVPLAGFIPGGGQDRGQPVTAGAGTGRKAHRREGRHHSSCEHRSNLTLADAWRRLAIFGSPTTDRKSLCTRSMSKTPANRAYAL